MSRGLMINFNNTNRETNTRYLDSNYADAPSLKNEYGSLNSLLKKVLIEGFNIKTTISLEHDIESKIATLQLPEGHGFIFNQVVELSGALEENFNGVFRVLEVRGNALKLQIPNESVHTVATTETTLSIKLAPLGFDLAYENIEEGVVCFKNKSLKSPGILKVIDKLPPNGYASNWAKYGRVVMGQQIDDLGEFINNNKAPFWPDNPEVEKVGYIILVYYIGTGLFLGIITLMDDGMELSLGFHAANNMITALLITSDYSVFQTYSVFKDLSEPSAGFDVLTPVFVIFPILLFIFSKVYNWKNWKEKLTGKLINISEKNE